MMIVRVQELDPDGKDIPGSVYFSILIDGQLYGRYSTYAEAHEALKRLNEKKHFPSKSPSQNLPTPK